MCMYLYTYKYIYRFIYLYLYIFIYVYLYIFIYLYIYIFIYFYIYIFIFIYYFIYFVRVHWYMNTQNWISLYTHLSTCIYFSFIYRYFNWAARERSRTGGGATSGWSWCQSLSASWLLARIAGSAPSQRARLGSDWHEVIAVAIDTILRILQDVLSSAKL